MRLTRQACFAVRQISQIDCNLDWFACAASHNLPSLPQALSHRQTDRGVKPSLLIVHNFKTTCHDSSQAERSGFTFKCWVLSPWLNSAIAVVFKIFRLKAGERVGGKRDCWQLWSRLNICGAHNLRGCPASWLHQRWQPCHQHRRCRAMRKFLGLRHRESVGERRLGYVTVSRAPQGVRTGECPLTQPSCPFLQ